MSPRPAVALQRIPQNNTKMSTDEGKPFLGTLVAKPVELINYDCEISKEFDTYLKQWKFDTFNFNYNVLSILGCQSSGKSSLLNSVFGLEFDVMDTKLGHSQTTKGLWGAIIIPKDGSDSNATLVIDVEGTDSRERGDGRLTFEHRSSLLCLAISDCVIINLWYHSLGNLTGSNYGLLKTVMEANLELAEGSGIDGTSGSHKTVLCFCIRDWFPELAPLETVRQKIVNGYMMDIWNEIKKPDNYKNVPMENLFHVEIFGFNHALVKKDEFLDDSVKFREAWKNKIRPKTYSRQVPSDGFFYYAQNILNTVKEQSHLDIPTQREMLANIRCQEIKSTVLASAASKINEMLVEAQEKQLENFNDSVTALLTSVVKEYYEFASRYDKTTSVKIGIELINAFLRNLQPVFDANISHYCKELIIKGTMKMEEKFAINEKVKPIMIGTSKATEVWPKFTEMCEEIKSELMDALTTQMTGYNVTYTNEHGTSVDFAFDRTASIDIFNVTFKKEVEMLKTRHLQCFKTQIADLINNGFTVIDETLLERELDSTKYWGDVNDLINKAYKMAIDIYKPCYEGLIYNVQDNEFEYLSLIVLLENTKKNLERIEGNITNIIVGRFEQFFQYQEFNGELIPRAWEETTEAELKQIYAQCKKDALNIVAVLRDCKPPKLDMPAFNVDRIKVDHILYRDFNMGISGLSDVSSLLNEENLVNTVKACRVKCHELYRNAQKIQSSGSTAVSWKNIPPAFWIILLICGWNEMLATFKLLFKVQFLIPLVLLIAVLVQYCSTAIFGERANKVLDPIKAQAMAMIYSASQWAMKTAIYGMTNMGSSSGDSNPSKDTPDNEDKKEK